MKEHPPELLRTLRQFNTPTLSNAIEPICSRPWNEGFCSPDIKCLFPELGVMVGYAATVTTRARTKPTGKEPDQAEYLKYLMSLPVPRIAVVQDLDNPRGCGAFIGEIMANTHQACGCIGVVTDGALRDLDEVRPLGFWYFAAGVCVSHAYIHVVDFGKPVTVGGLTVESGDLIAGDKHGVLKIPHECAADIPRSSAKLEGLEKRVLALVKSPEFSIEKFKALRAEIKAEAKRPDVH